MGSHNFVYYYGIMMEIGKRLLGQTKHHSTELNWSNLQNRTCHLSEDQPRQKKTG
jgi:hypothetical protein